MPMDSPFLTQSPRHEYFQKYPKSIGSFFKEQNALLSADKIKTIFE
jgi:hypothetical protein